VPGNMIERDQRRWRIDEWNLRDLYYTVDLWKECLDDWPMDAHTLSVMLNRPEPFAKHFVVRDGKTNNLLGFAATYCIQAGPAEDSYFIGSLACLLVLPSRRNLGIGLSLHDHVMRFLKTRSNPSFRKVQLGSIFPRFFPGLPTDIPRRQQAWFRHRGWKLPTHGEPTCSDLYCDLTAFAPPPDTVRPHVEAGVTFRACTPAEFDAVMQFERAHFTKYPGWIEAHLALRESGCVEDLILAVDAEGKYLASAIAYCPNNDNPIGKLLPWPRLIGRYSWGRGLTVGDKVGGVTCVGQNPDISMPGLGYALLCVAIEDLTRRGMTGCFMDWVPPAARRMLSRFRRRIGMRMRGSGCLKSTRIVGKQCNRVYLYA
jgi:beta-N-acetylhexosaminidase